MAGWSCNPSRTLAEVQREKYWGESPEPRTPLQAIEVLHGNV